MDLFRSKKRDVEQASLDDGPGLKRKHHGLSNSLDNLLDIAKENDDCYGGTSDNTASESDDDTNTNKVSRKQKALAKISIKREKKKEKELRKKTEKNMISMDDFLGKQAEFKMWLYEEKSKNAGEISSPKLKVFFKQFVRLWNKKKLAPKFYRSSTLPSSPLTPRTCNFLSEAAETSPLPVEVGNPSSDVNPPTSPFVTFGKTPPKVLKSKMFQLFGSSKEVALLSVAPIGSPQVVRINKDNATKEKDHYQMPKIGKKVEDTSDNETSLPGGAVPYKVSVFSWAANEEDSDTNSNNKVELCSTATPPNLNRRPTNADETWPPPPSEMEILGGNKASTKDSPHVPPPPPPRVGSLKKSDPANRLPAKSPKLAANYADPYDKLPSSPAAKREIFSHYQDPVDCLATNSHTIPENPRLVIQTMSQNDEPDLSLYCKPVSEKRFSKEELEEMYAKPLKRAKRNDIGFIDEITGEVKPKSDEEKESSSDLLSEIMQHINNKNSDSDNVVGKEKSDNVDTLTAKRRPARLAKPDPDYATIDECMFNISEDKKLYTQSDDKSNDKRDGISFGNVPLLQPKVASPKFASISRSKKMRVMAASTEKIYETYLSLGSRGNPFKGKLDNTKTRPRFPGSLTQAMKAKSKSQPDISFSEGLQSVDIDDNFDKDSDYKVSSPSLSTFKPVENVSKFHETHLQNSDRAISYEDGLKCVPEPNTPTIMATPSFDSLCNVTPLSCKSMSSQSLPTKSHSGSFESLSNHSNMSISTSSSLSFGPDEKSGSLQSLQSDKSLSPVKEEEENVQFSEKANKTKPEKADSLKSLQENDNVTSKAVNGTEAYGLNNVPLTPGKISALKHGIDLSVYLLKPQKDDIKTGTDAEETAEKNAADKNSVSAKPACNAKLFDTQSRLVIKDTLSGVRTKLDQGKVKPISKREAGRRHTVQNVQQTEPSDSKKTTTVPNIGIASKTRKNVTGKSERSRSVSAEVNSNKAGTSNDDTKKRTRGVDDHYLETDLDSVSNDRPRRPMKKSKSHSGFERGSNAVSTEIW